MTFQTRSYSTSSLLSTYSSSSERSLSQSPGPATPCGMMSRSPSFTDQQASIAESACGYPARDRSDHGPHHDHQSDFYQQHHQHHQQRSSFGYKSSNTDNYFPSTPPPAPHHPLIAAPEHEDRKVAINPSSTPPCSPLQAMCEPLPVGESEGEDEDEDEDVDDGEEEEEEEEKDDADRSDSPSSFTSRSRSFSRDGSSFSPEPSASSGYLGSMSDASVSAMSLLSSSTSSSSSSSSSTSSSSNMSMTPVPTTTQLLLCPVCSRAFKPSKNQNCNLRRHLKNVHNMSPAIHPRKCKWDSLPDGRVKDDKDRKERTRKSKRLWARKFRQRRKVEEAAVVLSMLSQAL
ncbi:hypothetical protein BGZ72_007569 [Mortierella alpina]|nr:hypothetical protein BGZ72_007569 [Mortierella alpina]